MTSIASTALSGMTAALAQLDASANRVARSGAIGSATGAVAGTRIPAGAVSGDVSLALELVSQLQAKNAFAANLAVFKTANAIAGTLLHEKA